MRCLSPFIRRIARLLFPKRRGKHIRPEHRKICKDISGKGQVVVNSSIIQEMLTAIENQAEATTVQDIRIGLCYSAVLLDDGQLGLAYTFHTQHAPPCHKPFKPGQIRGKNTMDVVRYASSDNLLESAIGLAAINAIVNHQIENATEGDILDVIPMNKTDTVGMVGFFAPLIEPLKQSSKKLFIFEKKDMGGLPDVYPSEKAIDMLPECDVILLSATTLINKTIDPLLAASGRAREVIVLGASTPFLPEIFAPRGATMLSGIEVTDQNRLLQIVSEGGGMRDFKGSIKKITLLLKMD